MNSIMRELSMTKRSSTTNEIPGGETVDQRDGDRVTDHGGGAQRNQRRENALRVGRASQHFEDFPHPRLRSEQLRHRLEAPSAGERDTEPAEQLRYGRRN